MASDVVKLSGYDIKGFGKLSLKGAEDNNEPLTEPRHIE
jgi:hypothetical protein